MAPSRTRKEEAELRQVMKVARLARKESKKRAQKQRLRATRTAAAALETGGDTSAAPPSAPRKRQGALVLPSEIAELQRRLSTPTSPPAPRRTPRRKSKASTTSSTTPATTTQKIDAAPLPTTAYASPNHHMEVHFKQKVVLVDVVLHHVPHQKINVDESTPSMLVVDTTRHTKKYRLELPMPPGVEVNLENADYTLENGVLHCRLPIVNETLPAELEAEWTSLREKLRAQRALRFHVRQDGALAVRVRQSLLPSSSSNSNAKADHVDAATTPPPTAEESHTDTAAVPDPQRQERESALAAARTAARKARLSLKQRVELAKAVQQRRQERLQVRTERKEHKDERRQSAFARVVEEQKRQLLERAAHQAAVDAADQKRAAARKRGATKTVHFAK